MYLAGACSLPAASKKLPSLFRAAAERTFARPLTTIQNRDILLPSFPPLLGPLSHSLKWLIGFAIHGRVLCLANNCSQART